MPYLSSIKTSSSISKMNFHSQSFLVLVLVTLATILSPTLAVLTPDYYDKVCPEALPVIKSVLKQAILRENRIGASLLRLHFHDCFVNGCDGSVLLDDTPSILGEKTALPNLNSIRGFEVVDEIKAAVDKACKKSVVSCADILAVAARDAVTITGGKHYWYQVLLGRKDARNASRTAANTNLAPPFLSFAQLLGLYQAHGLDVKDLVVLSGGHSIGFAKCSSFQARISNDTNINHNFASNLQKSCNVGGNSSLAPLDKSPAKFDTRYYKALLKKEGLLHSDQELFKGDGSESDKLVYLYSKSSSAFAKDFGASMIKMGNIKPLTGSQGEVRYNCRKVNH